MKAEHDSGIWTFGYFIDQMISLINDVKPAVLHYWRQYEQTWVRLMGDTFQVNQLDI
jgi:hypothetical protein